MFRYVDKVDRKTGITHRNYFLTQGDSFSLIAKLVENSGEANIAGIMFKLGLARSECNIEYIFGKQYQLIDGEWMCIVKSKETELWLASCENDDEPYIYEIEVSYVDGSVDTIAQAEFTIEPQIKGGT